MEPAADDVVRLDVPSVLAERVGTMRASSMKWIVPFASRGPGRVEKDGDRPARTADRCEGRRLVAVISS